MKIEDGVFGCFRSHPFFFFILYIHIMSTMGILVDRETCSMAAHIRLSTSVKYRHYDV